MGDFLLVLVQIVVAAAVLYMNVTLAKKKGYHWAFGLASFCLCFIFGFFI